MAVASSPVLATQHGHAAAHSRLPINRLGLWLFFFSDSLLFATLAAARFYLTGTERPEELNQLLGLGITTVLLASSLTAYRAETAFEHGNAARGRTMLLLTIIMGAGFAMGVGYEWSIAHWTPADGYGTAFFSMTGMHAFHVITGVLFLIVIYVRAGKGHFPAGNTWPVTAMVMYWHFVDVVWVFFYPTLYLV